MATTVPVSLGGRHWVTLTERPPRMVAKDIASRARLALEAANTRWAHTSDRTAATAAARAGVAVKDLAAVDPDGTIDALAELAGAEPLSAALAARRRADRMRRLAAASAAARRTRRLNAVRAAA